MARFLLFLCFFSFQSHSLIAQNKPKLIFESGEKMYATGSTIVFSDNNRYLALTAAQEIKIYDLRTGLLIKKIKGEDNYSWVQFSNDFEHFRFTRLQNQAEPDDSKAFDAVEETFSGNRLFRKHHDKNGRYFYYGRAVNKYVFLEDYDTLRLVGRGDNYADTVLYRSSSYAISKDEKCLLVTSHKRDIDYYVINLSSFDTLYKINFSKIRESQVTNEEKEDAKTYGSSFRYGSRLYFSEDNRYIIFIGELWSNNKKAIKIYDCIKDSVIFNKVYTSLDNEVNNMTGSINFSPVSGIVTLPLKTGLAVYNAFTNDSDFVPVTKSKISCKVSIGKGGEDIVFNNGERVFIYNTMSRKVVLDSALKFNDVLINPKRNLVYLSGSNTSSAPITYVYDIKGNKIISRMEGFLDKVSPDGRVIYGNDEKGKIYLYNELLSPIKEINNCTPHTNRIAEGNVPGCFVFVNDGLCDYANKVETDYDFFAWNTNNLIRYKNNRPGNFRFSFNDLEGFSFAKNNFFFTPGYSAYSFNDRGDSSALKKSWGDLKCMKGNYWVFKTTGFPNFLDSTEWGDTVTIIKNTDQVIAKFPLKKNISMGPLFIDTLNKRIIAINDYDVDKDRHLVSFLSFDGKTIKERAIPNSLKMNCGFEQSIASGQV